ncbi:RagB/SusD family nutrient uptake outer membrane protein [Cytophagaceae bacterium DM2B3-1]|uniref:RagB/SusD family nutrient uptake outer membrane protein n=1 Tax=Xanthocytophaga flava TaxID=3048013 RepID=A0ABT7CM95_9BACT|nr:RagB/SusD family nutrient uptake outer membrane protein [Xanthocytophaga flavus]MDJ1467340.1 RagB/SusD family nutrient uptake outer membrane protein [Xanthocytophaga flavus]MDJ1494851.1 RagB/SusD family nutrient uptake outer membrane protein [Xanthocytophaga flavus]
MKPIKALLILTAALVFSPGCESILDEKPQSQIVPSFFNSPAGVLGGIAGVYNDIRSQWGTEGFTMEMQAGTDEFLTGASGSGPVFNYNGLNGSNFGSAWGIAFQDINTINGVLQYGQSIDVPEATRKQYLAQAKFLRGFWYFYLVQTFGDVPLHTEFITAPSQAASRQPVAEVYELIIKDLTEAAADLPDKPTTPFLGKAATKPVAQLLLAKAYLTRGWLNNTQSDFEQAATLCDDIIANKSNYDLDLWQDYGDAFVPANDYGKETMFVSDHMLDPKYGYYTVGGAAGGGAAQNLTPWFTNWNYPNNSGVNSYKNASGNLVNNGTSGMIRDSYYGRPYQRLRPNSYKWPSGDNAGKNYFLDQAFANRDIDSRYAKTFYDVYISNTSITVSATADHNERGIGFTTKVGVDTAVWLPDYEVVGAPQFVGTRPFKGIVVPPSLWKSDIFPAVKKHMDPSRGANFNDPSTRPCVLYRFADVYLTGAEAYLKAGNAGKAADLINVIRKRAAFRKTNTTAQNEAAAEAMTITAADVTVDFILDERSREFFGEWQRWLDLVRTRSLVRRVKAWNPEAGQYIQDFHMLRPIPQSQIDRVVEGPAFTQNTGY